MSAFRNVSGTPMPNQVMTMSKKEIDRLAVIQQIKHKHITQIQAAKQLSLTTRQLRRLQASYAKEGVHGLTSKRRGKPSNHQIAPNKITQALEVLQTNYAGFGPTFAAEKLAEHHHLIFSVETLRQLMIKHKLWKPKQRRSVKHHQTRVRRPCLGELVQIDGSPHDWFEGRGEKCCLLVFIDDATSKIVAMFFTPQETTQAYFDTIENYIKQYGRPVAFYSDKHSIFHINTPEASCASSGETQVARALRELDIELICAHSPQAKGRVERANKTLQDRLVKEMRIRGISDIEAANAYLPIFIEKHNQRFAIEPANPWNAHRKELPTNEILNLIFSHQTTRKLSKNLELSYQNILYQIQTQSPSYAMRGATVTVSDRRNTVTLIYKNTCLAYKTFDKNNRPAKVIDTKELNHHLDKKIKTIPTKKHPWRNYPSISQQAI
jgi:transposase